MSRRISTAKPAPTAPSAPSGPLPDRTLIIDPGAYTIKAGFASKSPNVQQDCHVIPNCLAKSSREDKTYVGSQLASCTDFGEMQFKRPVQKGYIVNWPTEAAIWENEFLDPKAPLPCDPRDTNLIITEAPNAPNALQTNIDQIVFEEFEFASAYRTIAPELNAYTDTRNLFGDPPMQQNASISPAECLLLIDSGHSHTTITPILHGRPINSASKRITIGGKHMSNYLAELISLRHFSLIDEPYIVDQIKEDCCFVSQDFSTDLGNTWKGGIGDEGRNHIDPTIVVDYVLPDYERYHRGFMRPHDDSQAAKLERLGIRPQTDPTTVKEEVFPLGNERFVVPELLFNPNDIGMRESGIPGTIMQCLEIIPKPLWQPLLANVMVVGGNTLIKGFVERLEAALRMLVPADIVVRVKRAEDPIKSTWLGGARLASEKDLVKQVLVTKHDYHEYGAAWVARQFATRKIVNK